MDLDHYPRHILAQHLSFVQQKATTEELVKAEDAVALGRTPWIKTFERWNDTHQSYVGQALENRIIAMKDGQIIAQGRPEALINEAFIADIFDVHSRIIHSPDHPPHIQLLN